MDTINKPVPVKWNVMRVSGILLILWSLISLGPASDRAQVKTAIDYFRSLSCPSSSGIPNTRIAFCITYKLIEHDSPLFAEGTTDQDKFTYREIKIRRQGQTLFINNQPLQFGESYNAVRRRLFNPWLTIAVNIGCQVSSMSGIDAFYVRCDANEVSEINPLGAIMLFGGIGLVILGSSGIKKIKVARGARIMEPPVPLKIKAGDIAIGFLGWVVFNSVYFLVLTGIYGTGYYLPEHPIIVWYFTIIAIPALYIMKEYYICAGAALAVIINAAIWIGITMVMVEQERFYIILFSSGVPLPTLLYLRW
jgi:hypothetical protein